jgi:phosphopantothenoylcysteine decarboxylase/phosphopantothenate--cysteine ligase
MRQRPVCLITAGPTVEDLDPVRFLSNRASGKLGFATAAAALSAGHRVILIHGPVSARLIGRLHTRRSAARRLTRLAVRSAQQMGQAVLANVSRADVVIMNAAVADFTPCRVADVKIKKAFGTCVLRLRRTVDILAGLGRLKRACLKRLVLFGFALETGQGQTAAARLSCRLAEAQRKMDAKNLDAIVLDTPEAMGAEKATFRILRRRACGREGVEVVRAGKYIFAKRLVRLGEELLPPRLP